MILVYAGDVLHKGENSNLNAEWVNMHSPKLTVLILEI